MNLNLPQPLTQKIVTGILTGYKAYARERKEKKVSLTISDAYAWTKGNHIDSAIETALNATEHIEIFHDKVGYVWTYLQLILTQDTTKSLIIIKNVDGILNNFRTQFEHPKLNNYLSKFTKINQELVTQGHLADKPIAYQIKLDLPLVYQDPHPIPDTNLTPFDRCYFVTYETDSRHFITNITLTMPDPTNLTLIKIESLTPFIKSSSVKITEEDLEGLTG